MRISDWSSDVCSSDLPGDPLGAPISVVPAQSYTSFDSAGIGRDAAGNIITIWRAPAGLVARRYKPDGTVNGSDILIDSNTSPAEVAMDAAGDFVVAWTRRDRKSTRLNSSH